MFGSGQRIFFWGGENKDPVPTCLIHAEYYCP